MQGEFTVAHIAFLGIIVQAASAVLLVVLFVALRRIASKRDYVRDWSVAFVGLAVAIAALAVRYVASEGFRAGPSDFANVDAPLTRALYFLYQAGKLAFFGGLATGAALCAGRRLPVRRDLLVALLLVYAIVSVTAAPDLSTLVIWQTPVAILASGAAALLLFLAPAARRTFGTRVTAGACFALALLWGCYARSFTFEPASPGWLGAILGSITRYNSFIDVLMQSVLAVGMVVALFQDLEREAEASRTERAALERRLAETRHLESLGVVVSGVAHELNNPLTAILGYSEELTEPGAFVGDAATAADGARVIHEQAQRCRSIVRDLLAFSRPRPPERERVAPGAIVERVVRGFAPALRRARLQVDVAIAPDVPSLEADPIALEQVLANLIDNALDASPPDSLIRVSARAASGDCELAVEDHGPGVPVELTQRVFEPFFTTKSSGQGTGLGLAVCRRIVTAHGGTIRAEGRPDGASGSRFVVRLPAVAPAAPLPAPAHASSATNGSCPRRQGSPVA